MISTHSLVFQYFVVIVSVIVFAAASAGRPSSPSQYSVGIRQGTPDYHPIEVPPSTTDSLNISEDEWRQSLPPGLRNKNGAPLHRIEIKGVVIYLLGTSHVSLTSCDDARLLMQHVRPDALFVELCAQRVGMLLGPAPTPPPISNSERENQFTEREEQHRDHALSLSQRGAMLYSKIQADYANKLNVTIGGEFREAFNAALIQQRRFLDSRGSSNHNHQRYSLFSSIEQRESDISASHSHPRGNRQCAIILGDRPVNITLVRAWESLRLWGKLKLMIALLWSSLRQPSEKEIKAFFESILNDRSGKNDLLTKAMEELGKTFPSLKRVIIEERDEFMVAKLEQTIEALMQSSDLNGAKVIVAVVGAGHCAGMLERLLNNKCALNYGEEGQRPDKILPELVKTKKLISNPEELTSLVTDIVLFDYSYFLGSNFQLKTQIIE